MNNLIMFYTNYAINYKSLGTCLINDFYHVLRRLKNVHIGTYAVR